MRMGNELPVGPSTDSQLCEASSRDSELFLILGFSLMLVLVVEVLAFSFLPVCRVSVRIFAALRQFPASSSGPIDGLVIESGQ